MEHLHRWQLAETTRFQHLSFKIHKRGAREGGGPFRAVLRRAKSRDLYTEYRALSIGVLLQPSSKLFR